MPRRIKHFGGQHETRPIKEKKQLDDLFYYLLNQIEKAKTPIKKYQAERNYMLFLVGINTAFRAEDLLQLRVCDVINGYISIKENKTGKMQNFKMNKKLHEEIKDYVAKYNLTQYDYMFMGQKKIVNGKKYIYPINRQQGHRIVSNTGKAIGIPFVFGLHSLRKTFGYQFMKSNDGAGASLLTLMKMYNHDSPDVTLRYVCWGKDDAEAAREASFIGAKKKRKEEKKDENN